MLKENRQQKIFTLLQNKEEILVKELCNIFQVSDMTIRRDLADLESAGIIRRTFGGAVINGAIPETADFPGAYVKQSEKGADVKSKIALKAIELIKPGYTIFIDSGTTTSPIARNLPDSSKITVVTSNLRVINEISKKTEVSAIVIGGFLRNETLSCYGPQTEEQIRQYKVDIAFLGASSVGEDGNFYDGYPPEAGVKKSIMQSASETYVLVDSSKFRKYELISYSSIREVTGIITDSGINPDHLTALRQMDANVIVVDI